MNSSNYFSSEDSFSSCRLYRWFLKYELSKSKKTLLFIGLNPSKASSLYLDPTLRRLLTFADLWDYGSLIVTNLFARVSSSPSLMSRCSDPIGCKNNQILLDFSSQWSDDPDCDLWIGWGNHGCLLNRNLEVLKLLQENLRIRIQRYPLACGLLAIGVTKKGHPCHPLYVSRNKHLRPFYLI